MMTSPDYPPCGICGGPNDMGEICAACANHNVAAGNGYFDRDPCDEQREAELRERV